MYQYKDHHHRYDTRRRDLPPALRNQSFGIALYAFVLSHCLSIARWGNSMGVVYMDVRCVSSLYAIELYECNTTVCDFDTIAFEDRVSGLFDNGAFHYF